ncbi:putative protein pJ64R [African swine fever virus]|uniref:J64R n=1 Tax=African swine fever virus TaxID=10497 RepID=A0A6G6AH05_ASF|nr:J64R [African swine fever virus]QZK26715.1 putative protein pJ64R [African swine fever virus]WAS30466.1 putative protein pJ64R [African swine fever virus]
MLLYIVIIVAYVSYKLVPKQYWPILMFMAYMVYTYEKLDINERSGFWKYIIAKLFRCHGCEICK